MAKQSHGTRTVAPTATQVCESYISHVGCLHVYTTRCPVWGSDLHEPVLPVSNPMPIFPDRDTTGTGTLPFCLAKSVTTKRLGPRYVLCKYFVHILYAWYTSDTHLVCMIRICYAYGTHMVRIWYAYGTHMVRMWYASNTDLRIWFVSGTHMERIWYVYGTHMEHIWHSLVTNSLFTHDTHMVRNY